MMKTLSIEFEKAVRFLSEHMPQAHEDSRKPVLFHGIRVGVYLYERGYSQDIVVAGLLHDILEDTDITEDIVRGHFGEIVTRLVCASTKNDSIQNGDEKIHELIARCAENGQDALIVKASDILDSFKWYTAKGNMDEIAYCMKNASAILAHKSDDFVDPIFDELKMWQAKYA